MILRSRKSKAVFNKQFIFISGCPRSGTSFLTKVIDSHPKIGILMEAIFDNRARHHLKANYWNNTSDLKKKVQEKYKNIAPTIIGNKVCNPDIWSLKDILLFCNLFNAYKIVWIVRNPEDVILSRFRRERNDHFNEEAKKHLPLDYSSKLNTWASSWNICVQNFQRIKMHTPDKVFLIYYEDLLNKFEESMRALSIFLEVDYVEEYALYNKLPHYNANAQLEKDLKYNDKSYKLSEEENNIDALKKSIKESLIPYQKTVNLFKEHGI